MRTWTLFVPSLAAAFALATAHAEQVIVRQTDYSNDSITDGGRIVACIVTASVEAPPDRRVLNFQFIQLQGRVAWKITGGIMDWKQVSVVANPVSDGSFSSNKFSVPNAFQKSLTPEGQLLGVLVKDEFYTMFAQAFFQTPYSVSVTWRNAKEPTVYYINKSPAATIIHQFRSCVSDLSA